MQEMYLWTVKDGLLYSNVHKTHYPCILFEKKIICREASAVCGRHENQALKNWEMKP